MLFRHNTTEKIAPIRGSALRRVILGVVLLVAVLNALVFLFVQNHSYNESCWLLRFKWNRLLAGPPVDWLAFGDSSGNQGFDAGLFAEAMGPTYNFCTYLTTLMLNDAQMLEESVKRHGPPKGVLLLHTYYAWRYTTPLPEVASQIPVATERMDDYLRYAPSKPQFLWAFAADRWLPLLWQPLSYRGLFSEPERALAPRYALDEWGFRMVNRSDSAGVMKHLRGHVEAIREHPIEISPANREAVNRICNLAVERGFDVYFCLTPLYEGAAADSGVMANFDRVLAYLQGVEDRCPRFHVLGPFPITEKLDRMESIDHVTAPAARDFTQTMIERLKANRLSDSTITLR